MARPPLSQPAGIKVRSGSKYVHKVVSGTGLEPVTFCVSSKYSAALPSSVAETFRRNNQINNREPDSCSETKPLKSVIWLGSIARSPRKKVERITAAIKTPGAMGANSRCLLTNLTMDAENMLKDIGVFYRSFTATHFLPCIFRQGDVKIVFLGHGALRRITMNLSLNRVIPCSRTFPLKEIRVKEIRVTSGRWS